MRLMTIHDVFLLPDGRCVIAGAESPRESIPASAIAGLPGRTVKLVAPGGTAEVESEVVGIDHSESLSGQKNFYVLLGSWPERSRLPNGWEMHAVD